MSFAAVSAKRRRFIRTIASKKRLRSLSVQAISNRIDARFSSLRRRRREPRAFGK
jgi:hypothetical protein